ncbi:FAD-dependent oxidoreductase [Sulfitobacter sp. D35]|uniref:FAD-dependent oxidoreductase n=1 Tax=Sulfitobacter sp. D35 TaxID=3083252 RepID=UPI00296F4D91|nr:FAD-dependent oxidoreductase [Sulfitobacter sp. D35]MDW4499184.1 FAD-dependent oxidoreductase [Sulfitobacter sp. D35]
MADVAPPPTAFDGKVETLVIGAGACGMVAALSAAEAGQDVAILERDATPAGSTALSAGLIPAAGTRFQREAGIKDTPDLFASDIQKKAQGENDPDLVTRLAVGAAGVVEWLADRHGLPFSVVTDFDYPGHSRRRMHGLPSRSGRELVDRLRTACEAEGVPILCEAAVTTLHAESDRVVGVTVARPDGTVERIGCGRLILACNGFGGNRTLVRRHMPQIADALWFGHDGNRGEAVLWGEALGAAAGQLGAYQGHGNVAHPHGILITWATITEGGIQVNADGRRFWNEAQGYSEAARAVLTQPGGLAWTIFDDRIAGVARQFADFRAAEQQGAITRADTIEDLAEALGLPAATLAGTLSALPHGATDPFGRVFATPPLAPPFCGVQVTGALFHTQGGLLTDDQARVLKADGSAFPNLQAGGGAACGVSGAADTGYLSGNGLLSAVVLGRLAGAAVR